MWGLRAQALTAPSSLRPHSWVSTRFLGLLPLWTVVGGGGTETLGRAARAGLLGCGCQPALWALFQKMGPHPCLPFPGGDERPWAWRVPGVVLSGSNAIPGTRQNPRTAALFQGLLCSPFRGLRAERKNGQLAPGRQRGVSGVGAAGCSLLTGVQLSVGVASPWGAAH